MKSKRWRTVLLALAIIVPVAGLLLCYAALSTYATAGQAVSRSESMPSQGGAVHLDYTGTLTFTPVATTYLPQVSTASSIDKWSLWIGPTQLRGANIYQRRVYPELDGPEFMGSGPVGPPYTQADFDALAALGANYVNISHPGLFAETAPYTVDLNIQNNLDSLLAMIEQARLFTVISFRTGPGRSEFTFFWDEVGDWFDASYLNDSMWQEQAAQDSWVEMWRYTAQRYRDNPIVVGYDLMVEPNSNEVGSNAITDLLDIWDPEEFYATYGGTLYDWNQLYPRITGAIRDVDSNTPILIGGMGYSGVEWLPYLEPTSDPRTVYIVHQYGPIQYTHQWWDGLGCTYPGLCDLDWDGNSDDQLDLAWLQASLSPIDAFSAAHSVPVAVNEFSVMRWVPNGADFLDDEMDLFEQRGINHALWVWDPAWESWTQEVNAFNFRFGPDPNNLQDVTSSDLITTIVKYWERNTETPPYTSSALHSTPIVTFTAIVTDYLPVLLRSGPSLPEPMSLAEVTYWGYQIQSISTASAVDDLEASHYDMLVLEPTRTDWSSSDRAFDTKGMVARFKSSQASDAAHRKLVIAYIDIGEAEDWRWYWTWTKDWTCETPPPADWPDYILACDPDGWTGNYPVAYWDEDWKDIVIYGEDTPDHPDRDYNSIIDEVIKDGFDGIYLDWVEAFENTDVITAAQQAGLDPAEEMITFIQEMGDYATARNPGFVIIQQNGASLIDGHPELLTVIDAISQEAIWYDGDATDAWDDPAGYDWENDSDLVSYYLDYLDQYVTGGLPVLDCEYALAHSDTSYANAHAKGYVPYVTRRSLSRLTTTPPAGLVSIQLAPVNDFLYQLQNLDLSAIGNTAYDLVVMDYSADGSEAGEFTSPQISTLKHSPGGEKIILAYMSIGEAEDYRFYWDENWDANNDGQPDPGAPGWLDVGNPDWAGNYKVHYWDPAWQTIILSYTDRLMDAGFDGAYLDIIDAYEYYADQGRTTAAQEMVDFVTSIRDHARTREFFYIFPQNAPELAEQVPDYLRSVDGIGQEDIYYGYDDDDVMTPIAVTTEIEGHLDQFKTAGKLVLTVDYTTTPAHIDDAYAKSLVKGYIPFATGRDLDQLTINPGHEPD